MKSPGVFCPLLYFSVRTMRMLLLFIIPENTTQVDRKLPGNTNPDCHRAKLKTCQCSLKSHHHLSISWTNLPRMLPQGQPAGKPQVILSQGEQVQVRWIWWQHYSQAFVGRPTTVPCALPNIYIKAKISSLLPTVLQEVSFPSPRFMLTPYLLPFFTTSLCPLHSFKQCHFPHTACFYFYFPLTMLPSACHTWATDRSQHFSARRDLCNVSELILHTPSPSP